MGLQKIVILCALGVVIVGGALYLTMSGRDSQNQTGAETNEQNSTQEEITEVTEEKLSGVGSMMELFTSGKSIRCTYMYEDDSTGTSEGISYFDGDRMRIDSTVTQNGKTFESHMINNQEYMWSWSTSNEGDFAFMMPAEEGKTTYDSFNNESPQANASIESLNETVTYDCSAWNVDESVFTAPENIKFVNIGEMMGGMMQNIQDGNFEGMMEGFPIPQ